MKKVGNFQTEDKNRLSEQLDRFQDYVDSEAQDIRSSFVPTLKQARVNAARGGVFGGGQIVICDTSLNNVDIVLAAASTEPGWLAVVKCATANTLTVFPSGVTALGAARRINATTAKAYVGAGATAMSLHWIYFDGSDWWA